MTFTIASNLIVISDTIKSTREEETLRRHHKMHLRGSELGPSSGSPLHTLHPQTMQATACTDILLLIHPIRSWTWGTEQAWISESSRSTEFEQIEKDLHNFCGRLRMHA